MKGFFTRQGYSSACQEIYCMSRLLSRDRQIGACKQAVPRVLVNLCVMQKEYSSLNLDVY